MTNKICISGYYGFDNFGDETILKILVENLKKMKNIDEITVFSSNPDKTSKNLGVNSVRTFCPKDVITSLFKSTCLISGGGSLLQDVTGKKSIIYYLMVLAIAQFFHKKTIIFAQGIGPINNKFLAKITEFILKKATYTTVRDENSYTLLNKWGIKSSLCSDPVWNLEVNDIKKSNKIGVQLRSFSSLTDEKLSDLAFCINKYYQNKEILLISLQNSLDIGVCKKLKEKLTNLNSNLKVEIIENSSNDKIIEIISSLDELIAMRYHACLVAIKCGVKLLPISYDIKVKTIAKEFNLPYIDLENPQDNISNDFEDFIKNKTSYNIEKIENLKFNFNELEKHL